MSRRPAERRTQHAVMATASEWARIRELAAAADMDLSRYAVLLAPGHGLCAAVVAVSSEA